MNDTTREVAFKTRQSGQLTMRGQLPGVSLHTVRAVTDDWQPPKEKGNGRLR
jgi:hypothetical protein